MVDVRGAPDRRSPHQVTDRRHRKCSSSTRVALALEDDGSTRQQQDSEAAISSKTSKAMDDRPSRSHDKKSSKTDSSIVSVVDRSSRSDGPSGTRGSDRHRSHSDERGRRDRHRGSERRHEPRACHSPRLQESGEWTRPLSSSGRSVEPTPCLEELDLPGSTRASGKTTDVRPSSTHHHHHPRAISISCYGRPQVPARATSL